MKRFSAILLLMTLFLVAGALSVSATLPSPAYSSTAPTWGSATQVASNPEDDDVSDRNVTTSTTITIATGTGDLNLTTVTPVAGLTAADIEITETASTATTITLRARITEKLDAVDTDLTQKAFKVADIIIVSSTDTTLAFPVFMQRENNLEIDDIDVTVVSPAGSRNTESLDPDENDDVKDVKPGDSLEFEIKVQNNFGSDSNTEIENVDVEVNIGDEIDEEENEDLGDLSEDDDDTVSVTIDVEDDASDGSNNGEIRAQGDDIHGARHGDVATFDVEIERERHDILITSVSINPEELQCSDNSFQVSVKLLNLGKSDEDEVAVELEGRTLGVQARRANLEMNEDDSQTEVFDFTVDPNSIEPGVHVIQIQTFTDNIEISNSDIVQLNNACGETDVPEEEEPTTDAPVLSLSRTSFDGNAGSSVSIPVQVTNTENRARDYTISITNAGDFAEQVSPKTVSLNPGQTSTVFMNMKISDDAEDGSYSATVNVKAGSALVASDSVNVVVGEGAAAPGKISTSTFWIIADILLIVIAIVFVILIFRGRSHQ